MLLLIITFFVLLMSIFFSLYRRVTTPTHAGGIVFKKEKHATLFLIVTSSSGTHKWVLPKGKIEKNESPKAAAMREVLEETGVTATPIKQAGNMRFTKKRSRVNVVYFFMQFEDFSNTAKEGRKIAWVEKREALERLARKDVARLFNLIPD